MRRLLIILAIFLPGALSSFAQVGGQNAATLSNPYGGDLKASSTDCSVAQACAWQKLPPNPTVTSIVVSGTFVATLQFEQSANGVNFVAASPASTTTTGTTTFTTTGFTDFRVRVSAYTSGTASVNITTAASGTGVIGGGGGGGSFSLITAGTNTAALVIGAGGSLTTSGGGTIAATSITSAGVGAACGSTTQVIFNNAGACAGAAGLTFDGTNSLTVGNGVQASNIAELCINNSGASNCGATAAIIIRAAAGTNAGRIIMTNAAANQSDIISFNASDQFLISGTATGINSPAYATATNCSSSASPAVCGSAAAGSVAVPTGTNVALQVNTTAVTANSAIIVVQDSTLGTKLGVTCNSTLASLIVEPVITARTGGSNFTVTISGTTTTNPVCLSYFIVN